VGRRGIALLEALVALAILSIGGLSMLEVVGAAERDRVRVEADERSVVAADRVMTAMSLLTREDLDRRLGSHPVGEFAVTVARPEPTLYRIAIADTLVPGVELMATVVYRPAPGP
jgi:type II secretory pathway pseudopilin PulG